MSKIRNTPQGDPTLGPLTNPKHERYAQARASGKPLADAYEAAGFKRDRGNAHQLENARPQNNVKQRILELVESGFKDSDIDSTFIIGGLAGIAADKSAKHSDQIAAYKVLADIYKLTGQYRSPAPEPERLSKEERHEMLKQLLWHAQREQKQAQIVDVEPTDDEE